MRYILLVFSVLFFSCGTGETRIEGTKMGMNYSVLFKKKLNSSQKERARSFIEVTFQDINNHLNGWNKDSEVSLWNRSRSTAPIKVSQMLLQVALLSDKANRLTNGCFDPSLGKATRLWKMSLRLEQTLSNREVELLKECSGWDKILIHQDSLQKTNPDVELDFDGITKGFFCDYLGEKLSKAGFTNFLVEWGGEIKAIGGPFTVYNGRETLTLRDLSIATSGPTFQCYRQGKAFASHFIDPGTHKPVIFTNPYTSKSFTHASCSIADALATASFTQDD